LCGELSTQTEKDDCYYSYATSYPYDVSVCDYINSSYRKENCIYYANYTYYY
jgi:carbohydrate-binding DOMON domain-containing protein